jgi:acyl-CoA thioesterase-1
MAFNRILGAAFVALSFLFGVSHASAQPIQIVAFGDSLTAGFGLDPGQAFPEKLQAALITKGHDVVVANAGVSGDTSSGGLSRLDWSVPDGTQLVILELGANDMLRGITPDVTEKNLDAIIARLKERNIPVLLAGMLAAPNLGPDYAEVFNRIYPGLAEKHGIPLYPFFMQGVAADMQFLLEDGMHPNPAGVDRMVEGILPALEQALATISGDS